MGILVLLSRFADTLLIIASIASRRSRFSTVRCRRLWTFCSATLAENTWSARCGTACIVPSYPFGRVTARCLRRRAMWCVQEEGEGDVDGSNSVRVAARVSAVAGAPTVTLPHHYSMPKPMSLP